jgi:WD40 repeat protein
VRIIQSATPRPLNLLAVGPNGLVAAASGTFGAPGDVEVWDVATGQLTIRLGNDEWLTALALTADGCFVLLSDSVCLRFIELSCGQSVSSTSFPNRNVRFAPSADAARFLVINSRETSGEVACYTMALGGDRRRLWFHAEPLMFGLPAFAPSGCRVAVAALDRNAARPNWSVQVRNADRGDVCATFRLDPASPAWQLAFTADGAKLLVRTDSNVVQVFDAATGAEAGALKHKGRPFVTGIAVHPRGPVACARTDGTVTLWDADAREQRRVLDWKAGRLVSVAFAPDGALAAAGTEDGKVIVWDVDE